MDLLKVNPNELLNRYLALNDVRQNYTPEQVKSINPDFILDMFDEDDKPVVEFDWDYAFFMAETAQVQYLMSQLWTKYPSVSREEQLKEVESKLEEAKKMDEVVKKVSGLLDKNGKPF